MEGKERSEALEKEKGNKELHNEYTENNREESDSFAERLKSVKTEKAQARRNLTLLRSPLTTLKHFFLVVLESVRYYLVAFFTHRVSLFVGFPLFLVYVILRAVEGSHTLYVREVEEYLKFGVWWMGLGILSSVGLGTGMHTGLLFLFPHIMKVCLAASECNTVRFETRSDMWFTTAPDTFMCPEDEERPEDNVQFWQIFMKVFLPCLLWGAGTAIGEIPPYAISRAASLAGKANEEFEELTSSKSSWNFVNTMKDWMIEFLKKHGFIGVLLMAAWPNMAFDLCGICCGHFLMPFWSFFGATLIGKGLIKVNLQACFFIMLFTKEYLTNFVAFIERLIPDALDPCAFLASKECHTLLHELLQEAGHNFHRQVSGEVKLGEEQSFLKKAWGYIIFLFIGYFVVTCIEQFAQQRAAKLDNDAIEQLVEQAKMEEQKKRR